MAAFESITGVKLVGLVGGVIGSLVAMSFSPALSVWNRLVAFATGVVCAAYLQPLASHLFGFPTSLDAPVAFVVGVMGMGLVGAAVTISRDPLGAWRKFRGGE